MTRDQLEALIWQRWPTRGTLAEQSVEAILQAVDAYAYSQFRGRFLRRRRRNAWKATPRPALRHTSGTDLYPIIGALADALLGESEHGAAA